jgi:hypothetical protein
MLTVDRLKRDGHLLELQMMRDQSTHDGRPATCLARENGA